MTQMATAAIDYGQLFHQAPAGYIVSGADGTILAATRPCARGPGSLRAVWTEPGCWT